MDHSAGAGAGSEVPYTNGIQFLLLAVKDPPMMSDAPFSVRRQIRIFDLSLLFAARKPHHDSSDKVFTWKTFSRINAGNLLSSKLREEPNCEIEEKSYFNAVGLDCTKEANRSITIPTSKQKPGNPLIPKRFGDSYGSPKLSPCSGSSVSDVESVYEDLMHDIAVTPSVPVANEAPGVACSASSPGAVRGSPASIASTFIAQLTAPPDNAATDVIQFDNHVFRPNPGPLDPAIGAALHRGYPKPADQAARKSGEISQDKESAVLKLARTEVPAEPQSSERSSNLPQSEKLEQRKEMKPPIRTRTADGERSELVDHKERKRVEVLSSVSQHSGLLPMYQGNESSPQPRIDSHAKLPLRKDIFAKPVDPVAGGKRTYDVYERSSSPPPQKITPVISPKRRPITVSSTRQEKAEKQKAAQLEAAQLKALAAKIQTKFPDPRLSKKRLTTVSLKPESHQMGPPKKDPPVVVGNVPPIPPYKSVPTLPVVDKTTARSLSDPFVRVAHVPAKPLSDARPFQFPSSNPSLTDSIPFPDNGPVISSPGSSLAPHLPKAIPVFEFPKTVCGPDSPIPVKSASTKPFSATQNFSPTARANAIPAVTNSPVISPELPGPPSRVGNPQLSSPKLPPPPKTVAPAPKLPPSSPEITRTGSSSKTQPLPPRVSEAVPGSVKVSTPSMSPASPPPENRTGGLVDCLSQTAASRTIFLGEPVSASQKLVPPTAKQQPVVVLKPGNQAKPCVFPTDSPASPISSPDIDSIPLPAVPLSPAKDVILTPPPRPAAPLPRRHEKPPPPTKEIPVQRIEQQPSYSSRQPIVTQKPAWTPSLLLPPVILGQHVWEQLLSSTTQTPRPLLPNEVCRSPKRPEELQPAAVVPPSKPPADPVRPPVPVRPIVPATKLPVYNAPPAKPSAVAASKPPLKHPGADFLTNSEQRVYAEIFQPVFTKNIASFRDVTLPSTASDAIRSCGFFDSHKQCEMAFAGYLIRDIIEYIAGFLRDNDTVMVLPQNQTGMKICDENPLYKSSALRLVKISGVAQDFEDFLPKDLLLFRFLQVHPKKGEVDEMHFAYVEHIQKGISGIDLAVVMEAFGVDKDAGNIDIGVHRVCSLMTFYRQAKALSRLCEPNALFAKAFSVLDDVAFSVPTLTRPRMDNVQAKLPRYNSWQQKAVCGIVHSVLENMEAGKVFALHAPPGTGKLYVAAGVFKILLEERPTMKFVLTVPTNNALEETVQRMLQLWSMISQEPLKIACIENPKYTFLNDDVARFSLTDILRRRTEASENSPAQTVDPTNIPRLDKKIADLQKRADGTENKAVRDGYLRKIVDMKAELERMKRPVMNGNEPSSSRSKKAILAEHNLVVVTVAQCGSMDWEGFTMDCVIMHNAGQVSDLDTFVPVTVLKAKKLILLGTRYEIPVNENGEELCLRSARNHSFMERAFNYHGDSFSELLLQYHMHPQISMFPSAEFHETRLMDARTVETAYRGWNLAPFKFFDFVWAGQEEDRELNAVVALVNQLLKVYAVERDYVILTVTSEHCQKLRALLRLNGKPVIKVNTLAAFQGKKSDIVVFCALGSSFLTSDCPLETCRLYVGLTAARKSLFIVGRTASLKKHEKWEQLRSDAVRRRHLICCTDGSENELKELVVMCIWQAGLPNRFRNVV